MMETTTNTSANTFTTDTATEIKVSLIPNGPWVLGSNRAGSAGALLKTRQLWPDTKPGCGVQVICYTPHPSKEGRSIDLTNHGWLPEMVADFDEALAPGFVDAETALRIASNPEATDELLVHGHRYILRYIGDWSAAAEIVSQYPSELRFEKRMLEDFRFLTEDEIEAERLDRVEFNANRRKMYAAVQSVIDKA